MKRVLGLDLGTNSVGYCLVDVDEKSKTLADIVKLGVRIVPTNKESHRKFCEGVYASKNAARTKKRGERRLNQRYKLRRKRLIKLLQENNMMPDNSLIDLSPLELYGLRDRAYKGRIELQELGRLLLLFNQRRGFKSNRKSQSADEKLTDYKQKIEERREEVKNSTIGSVLYEKLKTEGYSKIRGDVYPREEYIKEFDLIWRKQAEYYPQLKKEDKNSLYYIIRNEVIYFQRPLKSCKHLISKCRFERYRAIHTSSPLHECFRILSEINNLLIKTDTNEEFVPNDEEKKKIFDTLWNPKITKTKKGLNAKASVTSKEILKLCGFDSKTDMLNYDSLKSNRTNCKIKKALKLADIEDTDRYISFDPTLEDVTKQPSYLFWHICYSIDDPSEVINSLTKHFGFTNEQAKIICDNVDFGSEYGSLSALAIKKLLPYMLKGERYDTACEKVGYNHYEMEKPDQLLEQIPLLNPNELKNPVATQVLNQMINVVNALKKTYGHIDEVRIEMARELKSSAKTRAVIAKKNKENESRNKKIIKKLEEHAEFKNRRVSKRDIERYKLWEDTNYTCLYTGKPISLTQLFSEDVEIEHVIPKSRSFDNSFSNKIVSFRGPNQDKGQLTGMDYMKSKGEGEVKRYVDTIKSLYNNGKGSISKTKMKNLLAEGKDLKGEFIQRQLKDSQYIAKKAREILNSSIPSVVTTIGCLTDKLREDWGLKNLMQEMVIDTYRSQGHTKWIKVRNSSKDMVDKEIIDPNVWSKRNDHRHHAVDALIISLTTQGMIQRISNMNKIYEGYYNIKDTGTKFPCPHPHLRSLAKKNLADILVSYKKVENKAISFGKNKTSIPKKKNPTLTQTTIIPRGPLHKDTFLGCKTIFEDMPLGKVIKDKRIKDIRSKKIRKLVQSRFESCNKKISKTIVSLKEDPLTYKQKEIKEVSILSRCFTKNVPIPSLTPTQIDAIIDKTVKRKVIERIGVENIKDEKKRKNALNKYEKNPIYMDKDNKVPVLSVKVKESGSYIPAREDKDYVAYGVNHHMVIYQDEKGNIEGKIVPFWEVVKTAQNNMATTGSPYPLIDRTDKPGLKFLFSMQKYDLFVFDLDPDEIDFLNPINMELISKHLFRVQGISGSDYLFRHHLETTIDRKGDNVMKRIRSLANLRGAVKIKLDCLGNIIKVGE